MFKTWLRTACTTKFRPLTLSAELLGLLRPAKPMPHPALLTATATTLRKRLRTMAVCARLKASLFLATRLLGLTKVILTPRMFLTTFAFVLRLVHWTTIIFVGRIRCATIALRRNLAPLMFATALTIHRRTAKALAPRTLIRIAIASVGRIRGAGSATLWGIHRSRLPVALRLRAIALASHFWAALRITHAVRTGCIAIPAFVRTRLVTSCRSGICIRFGNCGNRLHSSGRLICRLGFLGLQWSDAESESTTKPGKLVGFGFHVSVLFRLTAEEETLVGNKSCNAPTSAQEILVKKAPPLRCSGLATGLSRRSSLRFKHASPARILLFEKLELTQSCETFSLINNQTCLSLHENNMAKLVIIDDEAAILELMTKLCKAAGHQVFGCTTGIDGIAAIRSNQPDLVIVDLRIGDVNGLDLVSMCKEQFPSTAVIMVTGHGSVETAVEAMRLGAFDYLTKPFDLGDLIKTVNQALQRNGIAAATPTSIPSTTLRSASASKLIGHSDAIQRIFDIVRRVANNDSPVLLEGEFGVGKHMVARALHEASRRSNSPYKELQCSAMPEDVLETELFGQTAIFNRVSGGTIHLAEINQLPARIQAQLNTFLDEAQSKKGWGNGSSGADFRLVVSSTTSLEDAVKAGKFREDLYYKLSVVPLKIPPLRERRVDVRPLVEHFLKDLADRTDAKPKTIDAGAIEFLEKYNWPGNVSELRNAIERACAFAENDRVRPSDLPAKVTQQIEITTPSTTEGITKLPIGSTLDDFIKGQERAFIQETLKYNSGSREKTASMLGVSIATLYRKMGLNVERKTTS